MARQEVTTGTTFDFLQQINGNFTELYNLPTIFYGVDEEPSASVGKIGDIYIQYENET